MEIKVTENNTDMVLSGLIEVKPELFNALGNELYKSVYDQMTKDKVVDTGRLRGSISYSTPYNDYNNPTLANKENDFVKGVREENTIVIGSNVPYASYVEAGTTKQRARQFLRIGMSNSAEQCKKTAKIILEGEK